MELTPKQRADQLINQFDGNVDHAIITVDELMDEIGEYFDGIWKERMDYYQEVIEELFKVRWGEDYATR